MFINTTGIVLREVKYGDNSKILTVLTSSEGKLTVSAHRAYSKTSKLAASTGLLVYSHMTLTKRKDRWTLTEAQVIEQFAGLRDDLELLSLGSYIAELTEAIADEDAFNPGLLQLCLNCLYALSNKIKSPSQVKLTFELRLAIIAGYEPLLEPERQPVSSSDTQSFEVNEGTMNLSQEALRCAEYILTCNPKRLFSFTINDNTEKELAEKTEKYLLSHLDRGFKTLDYYKKYLTYKM